MTGWGRWAVLVLVVWDTVAEAASEGAARPPGPGRSSSPGKVQVLAALGSIRAVSPRRRLGRRGRWRNKEHSNNDKQPKYLDSQMIRRVC